MIINYKLDNNMKKIFFIVLLSLLSQKVFAYDFYQWVGSSYILCYEYSGTNGVVVVGGSSLTSNLVIPSIVSYYGQAYWVVGIGDGAFHDCTGVTSVTITKDSRVTLL